MIDALSISAIIVAVLGAIGTLAVQVHLKQCKILGCCIESDCTGKTPPSTPAEPAIETTSPKPMRKQPVEEHQPSLSVV